MSAYTKMVVFLSLGLLAVFGWHFATVFGIIGTAPQTRGEFFLRLGVILVSFIVISAVTAGLIARKDRRAAVPDEREEKIELHTERVGLVSLYAGLLVVAWCVFIPLTPVQMANALLAAVCASEIIKLVYAMVVLRRGV